jgi:hypothetical protein
MPGPRAAKKATPTKAAKKASGARYNYSQLAHVALTANDTHNVYGVIVDATFPYKVSKDRFICSLKVVDPSLNGSGKKDDWASIIIYANRFEDLPIVHRMGDIIRVHRAGLRLYDDRRQFNVNVQFHGSWALFSTDKHTPLESQTGGDAAFAHSGKRATMEKSDMAMLAILRKWATSYFGSHAEMSGSHTKALKNAKGASGDFDVVAKIMQIHEFDEYTNELRLQDNSGNGVFYTLATKLKFPHLRGGQTVYIRSVTYDESSSTKNMLAQSHYTNICTFIHGAKAAGALANVKSAALDMSQSTSANVISAVGGKFGSMATTSLRDLFHKQDSLSGTTFRAHLQVIAVQMVKGNAQLMCKDASTMNNSNQYKILAYSGAGFGDKFFGVAADQVATSKAAADKVGAKVAAMTRFNSWLDCVLELKGGFYHVRDTNLLI